MKAEKKNFAKTAEEFDQRVDDGESIFDVAEHITIVSKKVIVDFPGWMVEALDAEAEHLGIPRQAIIKTIINEHFNKAKKNVG